MNNEETKQETLKLQKEQLKWAPKLDIHNIECLSLAILKENFDQYEHCKNNWVIMDSLTAYEHIEKSFARMLSFVTANYPDKYYPIYEHDIFTNALLLGQVVEDMYFAYRIKTDYPKCPLCGSSIFPHTLALSRRDNLTEICSTCAQKEAFQDFLNLRE